LQDVSCANVCTYSRYEKNFFETFKDEGKNDAPFSKMENEFFINENF
jgi:hypothetical protein